VVTDEPEWVKEHLIADDIHFLGSLFDPRDAVTESKIIGKINNFL
jgi:hypothetical protein